jgi:hypothetical protein
MRKKILKNNYSGREEERCVLKSYDVNGITCIPRGYTTDITCENYDMLNPPFELAKIIKK